MTDDNAQMKLLDLESWHLACIQDRECKVSLFNVPVYSKKYRIFIYLFIVSKINISSAICVWFLVIVSLTARRTYIYILFYKESCTEKYILEIELNKTQLVYFKLFRLLQLLILAIL